jgi:hypothetical protein
MINNITLTYPSVDTNSPAYQLNEWGKYTDSQVNNVFILDNRKL